MLVGFHFHVTLSVDLVGRLAVALSIVQKSIGIDAIVFSPNSPYPELALVIVKMHGDGGVGIFLVLSFFKTNSPGTELMCPDARGFYFAVV